jgi:hypothetical protein
MAFYDPVVEERFTVFTKDRPPLPQYAFMAWCSVEKHRDDFNFASYLYFE